MESQEKDCSLREEGEESDDSSPMPCNCVIDISTPTTLERDFKRWLQRLPECPQSCPATPSSSSQDVDSSPQLPLRASASCDSPLHKIDERTMKRKGSGTNLYGRPYQPGRPLNMEERRRIVELSLQGMKVNAISKTLRISHGCVSKIIARYRSTGVFSPATSPELRRNRWRRNKSDDDRLSLSMPDSSTSSPAVASPCALPAPPPPLPPLGSPFDPSHVSSTQL